MTQYPYPQDPNNPAGYNPYGPLPYATPGGMAPAKPTSVTVLAIFAIILGGLGTLCTGFGAITNLIQLATGSTVTAPSTRVRLDPSIQMFGLVACVVELALSITLLAIGIGALTLKRWARKIAVPGWSIAMIVWALIRLVIQIAWVSPATMEVFNKIQQSQAGRGGPPPPAQFQNIMNGAMIGGALLWFLIEITIPICLLVFWRRPHVVAAFESPPAPL